MKGEKVNDDYGYTTSISSDIVAIIKNELGLLPKVKS
jgi:hypothetical protein